MPSSVVNGLIPSHCGQQRVDVTKGKIIKKFGETNPIWLALIRFSCYVNKNGQQAKRRTLEAKLEGEPLFVLPPGGKIWKEGGNAYIYAFGRIVT